MGLECAYSFWDLFEKAHQRKATDLEKQEFYSLTQEARNNRIKKWAGMAQWEINERIGSDGRIYAAFAPSFH